MKHSTKTISTVLVLQLSVLLIITHINACLYYYISAQIGLGSDKWVYPGTGLWNNNGSHYDDTLNQKYWYSFYWSAMLLTSVLPNMNNPVNTFEIFFHCMDILAGLLLFATIVARVGGEISNISRKKDVFRGKEGGVKSYMLMHKVSPFLGFRNANCSPWSRFRGG